MRQVPMRAVHIRRSTSARGITLSSVGVGRTARANGCTDLDRAWWNISKLRAADPTRPVRAPGDACESRTNHFVTFTSSTRVARGALLLLRRWCPPQRRRRRLSASRSSRSPPATRTRTRTTTRFCSSERGSRSTVSSPSSLRRGAPTPAMIPPSGAGRAPTSRRRSTSATGGTRGSSATRSSAASRGRRHAA